MKNIFGGLPKIPDELGGYPFKSWWFYKVVKNKKLKAVKERLVSDGEIKVEQPLLTLVILILFSRHLYRFVMHRRASLPAVFPHSNMVKNRMYVYNTDHHHRIITDQE